MLSHPHPSKVIVEWIENVTKHLCFFLGIVCNVWCTFPHLHPSQSAITRCPSEQRKGSDATALLFPISPSSSSLPSHLLSLHSQTPLLHSVQFRLQTPSLHPTRDLACVFNNPCPPHLLLPHLLSLLSPLALSTTREGDMPGAALWMRYRHSLGVWKEKEKFPGRICLGRFWEGSGTTGIEAYNELPDFDQSPGSYQEVTRKLPGSYQEVVEHKSAWGPRQRLDPRSWGGPLPLASEGGGWGVAAGQKAEGRVGSKEVSSMVHDGWQWDGQTFTFTCVCVWLSGYHMWTSLFVSAFS